MRKIWMSFAAVLALAFASHALANTINVPADQPTIQAGIDAAVSGADEVVVAPGTYNEIIDLSGKAITVRSSGGAAVTTIDATGVPDPGDGLPVVRCDNGEGNDTVVEGFTITGGIGDSALFGPGFGGGMFLNGTSPTFRDCIIEANAAFIGGAAFVYQGSPIFEGCTIQTNVADSGGGGIYVFNATGLTLAECSVISNTSPDLGGGLYIESSAASVVITDSVFESNSTEAAGGAFYWDASGPLTIERTVFRQNTAGNPVGGAGAVLGDGPVRIEECAFISNSVNDPSMAGGALGITTPGDVDVVNCSFTGNSATDGGGAIDLQAVTGDAVVNCSFANNSAPNGSAVSTVGPGTSPGLVNCAMWGNTGSPPIYVASGTPTVDYSIVEGGWGGAGTGNLDADPLFADATNDDLSLLAGSPAIDAGDSPSASAVGISSDLDGNARLVDDPATADTGIASFGMVIDMGAYEHQPPAPCPGDLDGDGDVDLSDLAALLAVYGTVCS